MRYVVMFSSGAGSWAAARRLADEHGPDALTLLFADTRTEDEDNYRFLHDAAADIGAELGGATTPLTLAALRRRIESEPEQVDLFDLGGCGCFVDGA